MRLGQVLLSPTPSVPRGRKSVMKMLHISAISAWLVQMFEVAFSRRMCCSRVESVSTNPRLPLRVARSRPPAVRASGGRTFRASRSPRIRPAEAQRHAERLRLHG